MNVDIMNKKLHERHYKRMDVELGMGVVFQNFVFVALVFFLVLNNEGKNFTYHALV